MIPYTLACLMPTNKAIMDKEQQYKSVDPSFQPTSGGKASGEIRLKNDRIGFRRSDKELTTCRSPFSNDLHAIHQIDVWQRSPEE